MNNRCFLFGHRDAPDHLLSSIRQAVERAYQDFGIREFVVGGYGAFDRMAGGAVKSVKKQHEDISLLLLLPYHPAEHSVLLPEGFDGSLYPEGMESVPRRFAIPRANRNMVRSAALVICYVKYPGNSRELLAYAEKQNELIVLNLA